MNSRMTLLAVCIATSWLSGCKQHPQELGQTLLKDEHTILDKIQGGNIDEARRAILSAATIKEVDASGNIPLHYAAGLGAREIVALLIKHHADVNSRNAYLDTPLHWAALGGHSQSIRLLIENGADVDARSECGETSLHLAVDKGHLEAVKILVEHHASINLRTSIGNTVLDYVLDHSAIHDYLVANGACSTSR